MTTFATPVAPEIEQAGPVLPNTIATPLNTKYKVSVVIPAWNEAKNIPHVLERLPHGLHEVVLVDGHSIDGTIEAARAVLPSIRVVLQEGRGKGAALRSGFKAATGDIIVMLDADCSTDPGEIPVYVGALLAGAEFVKGSRFLQGGGTADMPLHRRAGNWGLTMLVRLLFGGQYTDLCYGYNAFWRRVVPQLGLNGDGFEIETMMNIRALHIKLRIAEVPSFESRRRYGEGRLRTIPDGWRVLKTIIRERLQPHRYNPESGMIEIEENYHGVFEGNDVLLERAIAEPK